MVYPIAIVAYKVVPVGRSEKGDNVVDCEPTVTFHVPIRVTGGEDKTGAKGSEVSGDCDFPPPPASSAIICLVIKKSSKVSCVQPTPSALILHP